jgi:hypothetical protein
MPQPDEPGRPALPDPRAGIMELGRQRRADMDARRAAVTARRQRRAANDIRQAVLESPDGALWQIQVGNDGSLTTVQVVPPEVV